jgi:hypothetical protein
MAYEYLELPSSDAPDPLRNQEVRRSLDEISVAIRESEVDE